MRKVVLAGNYPARTYEKLNAMLPKEQFDLAVVDTQQDYDSMEDAEILILRIFKAPKSVIARNPKLKMILRWGAGFDSVDIEEAGKRGILVTNTPGANANAVSELAVMLMMAVGRRLLCHTQCLRNGVWSKNDFLNSSFCLNNKVVGLIGGGNIGRQVAAKVQAFGAKVQYYDTFRLQNSVEQELSMAYVPFKTLIETSDIISLHVPLLESTRHMIGQEEFRNMKKGVILINTARGGLVDDCALVEALQSGKLSGAGLDGVENEPLSADDALLQNPNIIVTPHIGGGTADIGDIILPMLVQDILDFAEGKEPAHIVNQKFLI
ncbi:3-phosphoglycerate dehydrogenase [Clostridium sp. chh4-2]|uniref:2-hydroxyacid dehydrogenase n=1 Tax=Clostridium sp. chh4-2 TaxID=2067550 RepID=UPI000CCF679B|nr:2-hydroxyacid dehydrogenase [Clostridium sp. chh4-2]PNV59000.1 3-phosphoglycerate dehydrogenase [Clostridium sp. chh4-2]